ncbi:MAG: hypothetical protein E7570_06580 [Ruminococcaceae bacterium]|nr:hypothetical protein [Oscillospiraceae bacterium]
MKKLSKKFLSLLMAAAMVVTMIPTFAITAGAAIPNNDRIKSNAHLVAEYLVDGTDGLTLNNVDWNSTKKEAYFKGGNRLNSYILIDDNPFSSVSASTGFTISFDFFKENDIGYWARFFEFGYDTDANYYAVNAGISDYTSFESMCMVNNVQYNYYPADMGNTGYMYGGTAGTAFTDQRGAWHNLTVSMDSDGCYYYILDGTLMGKYKSDYVNSSDNRSINKTDFMNGLKNYTKLYIGNDHYNDPCFKGYMKNFRVFNAGYNNLTDAEKLLILCDYYEAKMNGTVYKNMSAAYEAYVAANRGIDAYNYGNNTTVDFSTLYNNLKTTTDAMTAWSAYDGSSNKSVTMIGTAMANASGNVLFQDTSKTFYSRYGYRGTDDESATIGNLNGIKVWIPSGLVMYYDGTASNTYFPTMFEVGGQNKSNDRDVISMTINKTNISGNGKPTITADDYFVLGSLWKGYAAWSNPINWSSVYSSTDRVNTDPNSSWSMALGKGESTRFLGNTIVYKGSGALSESSRNIYFTMYQGNSNYHYATYYMPMSIYIVDYAQVKNAISAKTGYLTQVISYKEGGLSTLFTKYDYATNYNLAGYFSSATNSNYATCYSNAENDAETAAQLASVTPTSDSAAYATMRSYLMDGLNTKSFVGYGNNITAKEIYTNATYNSTTLANYDRFAAAYADAVNHMAALKTNNYGHTSTSTGRTAAEIATELSVAYGLLEKKSTAPQPTISQISGQNYLGIGDQITIASAGASVAGTVTYKIYYDVNDTSGAADVTNTFAYNSSANVAIFPNASHNKAIVTAIGNDTADGAATELTSRTFYRINAPSFTGYYNPTLVDIPANGILDRDAILQAAKSSTNDDSSIILQYSYNGGESWTDTADGQIDAFQVSGGKYASVSTVTIRSAVKSGGNVVAHSGTASVTLARQADFGIYIESAGSTAKFFDAGNTGADKIIIYDTENYSDDIVYTIEADGAAVSGTGEDVSGLFTYDKTNGIDLAGSSKAAEAINGADYVTIKAYSRDVKTGNYDTYATASFYNEGKFDKLIYHESFNGTANGSTYTTNDPKGINITKGDYNSAGTSINVVANAGDRNGFAKSESGTSADMRKNALKISGTDTNNGKEAYAKLDSNPFANDLTKTYVKEYGATISFWRAVETAGQNTKTNIDSGTLKRDAIAFRRTSAGAEGGNIYGYYMIECTGNMSYTKTQTDYFDIVPGEYDVTQNSLSKYSGYWQHIAVTINPKAASVEEAIIVYIDGVPHPASTSYSQNYDISTSIDASGGEYAAASDTVAKTVGDLLDMICDSGTYICLAHDNLWQDKTNDVYLDDIRFYAEPLTQKEIWDTYYDEYSDANNLEGNKSSVTHDPTTITVYKLKSASNGMAAGSLVGQEFIDYYNVPSSNYTIEYYSYGTGLQIYHSTDNINWEIVGDNQGRVAYQSHDQFVKDNGNGTWSSLEYHTALSEVLTSIRNASDYNNSQKGAGHLVWAPHVSYNLTTNKWMMYVAISCWSGATSAIISMESADGTPVHFVARDSSNNQAYSVIVKSSGRPNAIDACTYYKHNADGTIDENTLYMAYGAWSQGEAKTEDLCTMQLNANGTAKYGASGIITYSGAMSAEDGTRICASQPSEPDGVTGEGAFITYHNGYYYLYVAYGVNDYNYVTRVFRSTSPTGPFVDYNGVQATNSSAVHGTQIMAPHYVTGDNYIYMSTGHDSIYKAVNNNGEVITIHSAHARPVSNNANGYKELPDYAMVTRQIALAGSVTITHPMFYTQSGWAISMPEQFNGTDTSHAITATQLDGLYKASTLHDIIDEGLAYSEKVYSNSTYSSNWDFSNYIYFLANDATSGEIYGTGEGFLPLDLKYELSYDTGDAATSTTTYITIKNGSGTTVAEGVVAMHNGTPELSYFNIEQGDFGGGVETRASSTVWSVKVDDLDAYADFNALDSAYAEGDALLKSLDGKTAQYNATSVQNLIDRLAEAKADVAVSTAKKKLVPASSQSAINTKADNITAAIAGLTPATSTVSEENFSTYEAAVSAINNIDPDAYEEIKDEAAPSGHIASAISTANTLVSDSTKTYENDYTINVIDGTADQERVDLAVDTILDALSYCTKKYAVSADAGVTSIGSKNGTYKDGYATYGTSMTFRAASEDTAWNLEVTSNTSHKKPAFYGYGQSITVKVTGALDVTTETRSGSEKKVRILRHYDNSTNERVPVQFAEFVSAGSYTLPSAANTPAIAFYSFDGYYIGETKYAAGATVTISEDTDIIAKYKYNASASNAITATALSGGTSISGTYAYNAKLELKGGENAYGWSVDLGNGKYRPFYVGADLTYYAMDSLNLVAEDETTFKAHGYSLPAVYLRNGGAIDVSGSKITFNAQVVSDNMDSIQECGILVAVPNGKQPGSSETVTPVTPEDFQVIVENSGQQMGYAILRAKSTKFVGANQIAIAVNNLPEGYVYRAYAIYNHGGALETVYTDVVS